MSDPVLTIMVYTFYFVLALASRPSTVRLQVMEVCKCLLTHGHGYYSSKIVDSYFSDRGPGIAIDF